MKRLPKVKDVCDDLSMPEGILSKFQIKQKIILKKEIKTIIWESMEKLDNSVA